MSAIDVAGWSAAMLMLLTFACRELRSLRTIALAASLCFIVYGALADLAPVLALHLLLVPIHVLRLIDACREHEARLRGPPVAGPFNPIDAPSKLNREPPMTNLHRSATRRLPGTRIESTNPEGAAKLRKPATGIGLR